VGAACSAALGRHGTPNDLVGMTIFLASSASDYVTDRRSV
jgi:hypothetical protein